MKPVKSSKFDGYYGSPPGLEDQVGELPYFRIRASDINANVIYSVWVLEDYEREAILSGANIMLGQVGEPIKPVSLSITDMKEESVRECGGGECACGN